MKTVLVVILVIALGGAAFSGFLVVREVDGAASSCAPVGEAGTVFGAPPCIYGFAMYLAIVIATAIGLLLRRPKPA